MVLSIATQLAIRLNLLKVKREQCFRLCNFYIYAAQVDLMLLKVQFIKKLAFHHSAIDFIKQLIDLVTKWCD